MRAERKAEMRSRFLELRARLEKAGQWQGARKFDEWLLERGEEALTRASRGVLTSSNSNSSCINCTVSVLCINCVLMFA